MAATRQHEYGVFPRPSHDEAARQRYAMGLRQYLFGPLREAIARTFNAKVAPNHEARNGRPLTDRRAARREALGLPAYQYFSDLHRVSQDMIWNSVIDTLDRAEPELKSRFRAIAGRARGSLHLDPALAIPRYISAVDIHCMPGNYVRSAGEDDLIAGALYDRGGYLYAPGSGPKGDGLGRTSLAFLRRRLPAFEPTRILDLGCGTGGPTLVYAEAFPAAEVHGVDIGAAMLRYGHLRAESEGRRIHFSQQDAARTNFAAASFDLVLSHILFHETSARAIPAMLAECRRLLGPGGVMLHVELPNPEQLPDAFTRVIFDGDAHYNNEPFWMRLHDLDWPAMLEAAGFAPAHTEIAPTRVQAFMPPSADYPQGHWVDGPFPLTTILATVPS